MHACARWDPQTGWLGQRRTAHRRSPKQMSADTSTCWSGRPPRCTRYAYSIADRPGVESDHLHSTHAAKLNSQCLQPQLRCLLVFNRHRSPRSSQVAADEETNCAQ